MSNLSEEPSLDSLLGALRADVVKVDGPARERIRGRLSAGVLTQLFGSALVPPLLQKGWAKSAMVAKTKGFAVAIALPAGMVLGASGHAWLVSHGASHPPAPATEAPLHAAASTPFLPPPIVGSVSAALPPSQPLPSVPVTSGAQRPAIFHAHSRGSTGNSSWLPRNRELSLLEKARTALSEGKVETTLSLVTEHARRYPRSTLDQERRALHIKALVAANRLIEARTRAIAFVRSYPNSTLRASVERSALSIP